MGDGLRGHKLEANRALVDLSDLRKLYFRVRSVKTQDEESRGRELTAAHGDTTKSQRR